MKKYSLIVFVYIFTGSLFANGLGDISMLSVPDVQIELPSELVGIFEFVHEDPHGHNDFFGVIEIYEDNRYWWRGVESGSEWGHVIEENGDYYFLPIGSRSLSINEGYYIREKTKIIRTENGFTFISTGMGEREFITVRNQEYAIRKREYLIE